MKKSWYEKHQQFVALIIILVGVISMSIMMSLVYLTSR